MVKINRLSRQQTTGHSSARLDGRSEESPSHPGERLALAVAFAVVVLFGAFLRVVDLRQIPPGLFFDEAANLFDVSDVVHGAHPLYFPRNNGREPFFFYWASLFARLWGTTPYAIRLASAMLGTLAIVTTYLCAREVIRLWDDRQRRADWLAIVPAFILDVTYTHLHYSRIGLRSISLPLFLALAYGLLLRGIHRGSGWSMIAAGVVGGASLYTYISSRIAPSLLLLLPLAPRRGRRLASQLILAAIVWGLVALPLGVYATRHQHDVQAHTDDVSILNPVNNHGDPVGAIIHGVVATLGAYSLVGTGNADQNLPGRPILDPILSVFLMLGLGVLASGALADLRARRQDQSASNPRLFVATFLIGWILTQSLPSMLSVSPPGYIRMTGALPALAIVATFGVWRSFDWLIGGGWSAHLARGLLAGALALSTIWTVRDYFWLWGRSPTAYQWMMGHKVDSAAYLNRWAVSGRVFLAPLYAQDNTIRFLTQAGRIDSFDIGASLVVPTNRSADVRYVFPASDRQEVDTVAAALPVASSRTTVSDPTGRFALLTVLEVPARELPPLPDATRAEFDGGIALVSARIDATLLRPGDPLAITLQWLARQRQPADYTVFMHLRDPDDHTVSQVDRPPAAGSFPTSAWQVGDLIWDRYVLPVPRSARPAEYRLVVGLYRLDTMQRLMVRAEAGQPRSNEVTIGSVRVLG